MVDLVKIRRKAKEKKEPEEQPEVTPADESAGEKASAKDAGVAESKPATPVAPKSKPVDEPKKAAKPTAVKSKAAAPDGPRKEASRRVGTKDEPANAAPAGPLPDEAELPAPPATDLPEDEPDEETLDRLERFKREAGKRRTWTAGTAAAGAASVEDDGSRGLELLRFRLAGEEYAVDIEKIVEIVPPRATTRVPNADHTIVGIMSLRGTIVTVFDLRRKLGHPPIEAGQEMDRRMIVVEREGETAGFLVDKVSRVVKLDPSELESHPVVSAAEQSDYVGGVFQAADGLVILLDIEKILASQN